jgi:type IV pilus assembly protein PilB
LDLDIEPFLVASSLVAILAQRLVRRLCPSCRKPGEPSADAYQRSGAAALTPKDQIWMQPKGCHHCGGTGYSGRLGVHELLVVDNEIREMISVRASEHAIRKVARRNGMVSLMEDGVAKAALGMTSLEEVVRIVNSSDPVSKDAAADQPEAPAVSPEQLLGRKPRILVVEDSSTISTVVKYFLELDGFEVAVADNGISGLEMAKSETPDLIISDVQMPGLDGMALVRALRSHQSTSKVPILMLTSEDSVESETKGFAMGADDYIVKPVEPRRLAARVRTALARASRG